MQNNDIITGLSFHLIPVPASRQTVSNCVRAEIPRTQTPRNRKNEIIHRISWLIPVLHIAAE